MFFTSNVWCSLRLLQLKTEGKQYKQNTSPKKYKTEIKIFAKDLKDNKDNSRHLEQKYARIFVSGHYLILVAHSFPRASLSENCSLLAGTDNVRREISEHIFAPNGDYCLYIYHSGNLKNRLVYRSLKSCCTIDKSQEFCKGNWQHIVHNRSEIRLHKK